jgi:hypothetical protein
MKLDKIFLDFEYIETPTRDSQMTICASQAFEDGPPVFMDLRTPEQQAEFVAYFNSLPKSTVILSWNLVAEVTTLLRLGVPIEKLRKLAWVDLWVESKMFMLTHPSYFSEDTSLKKGAVPAFKLKYPFDMKLDPIEIILKGKGRYNYEDWEIIKKYSMADVQILKDLLPRLKKLWDHYKVRWEEIVFRSTYVLECAYQYATCSGFPMDSELLTKIFKNRSEIKYEIASQCNKSLCLNIYRAKKKSAPKDLSFSIEAFEDYLKRYGLYEIWEKTCEEGDLNVKGKQKKIQPSTTEKIFEKWMGADSFISSNKDTLSSIYNARTTMKQLNSVDLSELLTAEGYIRTPPFPFHQVSGRSSPKPKLGFILNMVPWIRMCVKPKLGEALISIDWSQQEVAFAAYFSGDEALLHSYENDHYLVNAIICGYAPQGATKAEYSVQRNLMKAPSLGILYGMGTVTLAKRIEVVNGWVHDKEKSTQLIWTFKEGKAIQKEILTSTRAVNIAERFVESHKMYYTKFWDYVNENAVLCRERGFYKTPASGWMYFTTPTHKSTKLQNTPMQTAGAAVMQMAYTAASKAGISLVCSLHDAICASCKLSQIDKTVKDLNNAMSQAVDTFTGGKLKIRTEVKIFTFDNPYYDPRGVEMFKYVKKLVDNI